jgi:UDP-N-acetylmuramoyl-L-alanine---L-glutamate ligase
VVGVPQSGQRIGALIAAACKAAGNANATVVQVDDFDQAVPALLAVVPEGGVLLLSPAAPSFGRFADYRERGMRFRSLLGLA